VLVGLANHAGPDGDGRVPSVARLVRYTGLSERTVRTCLDRLDAAGIIRPCDPEIVTARIKRAHRRPKGWDLDLSLIRDDLTEADLAALEHQFPGLAARVAVAACPDADGLQSPHPAETAGNWPDGVHPLHPASGTGCNERTGGVQPAQPRGAAVAPEPSIEPSIEPSGEPSAASTRGREALLAVEGSAVAASGPGNSSRRSARSGG
jgi:hypothetical protein